MAQTQVIPTKFPKHDVMQMDRVIKKGLFISRSDIVREGARLLLKKNDEMTSDLDLLVKQMIEKKDFQDPEARLLTKIFLNNKQIEQKRLFRAEKKLARKLIRDSFGVITQDKNNIIKLTANGVSIAQGFLEGLMYANSLR